jgi:A/G-specific adenine glycosylase
MRPSSRIGMRRSMRELALTVIAYAAIGDALLAWYAVARRDLPWRRTSDPYRIWVSEIMLQQTQVATVIPYYERFLARFPSVQALAAASLDELLALWQGLGYYARARNLHAAARLLCERNGGMLPSEVAALRTLPGIGAYTAGAIASIAYGRDEPAIDANVIRVLCRLTDEARPTTLPAVQAALRAHAVALLPPGQAGDLNQALMELGATLCTPGAPDCPRCPLTAHCLAYTRGTVAQRPVAKPRKEPPLRELATALIEREGQLLIVRRVPSGLLGGLWETPGGELGLGESATEALARHLREHVGLEISVEAQLATIHHAYTHFRVAMRAYRCQASGEPSASGPWDASRWLSPAEHDAYGLTGVTLKLLARVPWAGSGLLL